MKQLWLIAALIALTAGSVQAVAVGWDRGWENLTGGAPGVGTQYAGSVDGNNDGSGNSWATVWADSNANYAALVTTGPTLGQGIILGTGATGKGTNNQFRLGINAAGQWEVSLSGLNNQSITYVDGIDRTVQADTTYTLGFAIDRDGATATVTISVNGTDIATAVGNCNGPIGSWAWGAAVNGSNAYTGDARYEVFVLPGQALDTDLPLTGAELVDEIALLPEPTALALLALGLAGVALRRRA